ncbi:MAG: FMN-binding negative transcriptional regulator [Burkholderiaceae bacterium]
MYTPKPYIEDDLNVLHAHMRQWSFATLITHGENGVQATHLPFLLETSADTSQTPAQDPALGVLVTHLARANPQYQDLKAGAPALVIFQGPHAFVSPSWYVNQLTFPTWNYTAIHARGQPILFEEPDDILAILKKTVLTYDTPVGGSWKFGAMPDELIRSRMKAIFALRIPIATLEGKFKLNQDKTHEDRLGVVTALEQQNDPQSQETAAFMRAFLDLDPTPSS